MPQRIILAIDGPAGSGKSTVARLVADRLGFLYIDTGAMYRAVALWALRLGVSETDMHRMEQLAREADIQFQSESRTVLLNGEDVTSAIRETEVSSAASRVAAIPAVRRALVEKQRQLGQGASIVMEGRDIGTVVFPEATIKFFVDASHDTRVARRCQEIVQRNGAFDAAATANALAERDHRDRSRTEAPLMQAPDAIYLDTTSLSREEAAEIILKTVRERTANGKEYHRGLPL